MRMKTTAELRALLLEAEQELDAATRRSEVNEAASKLRRVKVALKRLEPIRRPRLEPGEQRLAVHVARSSSLAAASWSGK